MSVDRKDVQLVVMSFLSSVTLQVQLIWRSGDGALW